MEYLFEIKTPLNVTVRITENYWNYIINFKHRPITGKEHFQIK